MSAVVEVSGVVKTYGGIRALDGCELEVHEGEINGLIGPNGSGKTTLFNVITGYERVQEGKVSLRGTDITNTAPDRIFGFGIGRTFQLTRMFPRLTVVENILVATQREEGWLRSVTRLAGSHSERHARSSCWSSWASRGSLTNRPGTSPSDSASSWSSLRCSSPTRTSCCSTSPREGSTQRSSTTSPIASRSSTPPARQFWWSSTTWSS